MSLKLPQPAFKWDQTYQVRLNQAHEAEDVRNRKVGTDIELGVKERFILRSSGGARWSIAVADDGTISAVAL